MVEEDVSAGAQGGQDEPRPGFDLVEVVLLGLARTWIVATSLVVLCSFGGLVLSAVQPNTYTSQAKLLLLLGEREKMTSEVALGAGEIQRDSLPTLEDEVHLLSDQANYEKVAKEIGPELILRPLDPRRADGPKTSIQAKIVHRLQAAFMRAPSSPPGAPPVEGDRTVQKAVKALIDQTTLHTERNSNVITVVHTSNGPEKACAIVQALVNQFVQRHRELFSISRYIDESQDQLQKALKARDEANEDWSKHVRECGFIDLETQRPALLTEVETLETELYTARTHLEELVVQRRSLSERLGTIPPELEQITPAVKIENAEYTTIVELKRALLQAKQGLPALGLPVDETRRREKSYDEEIEAMDKRIASVPVRLVAEPEVRKKVPNPAWVEVKRQLDALEIEALGLETRIPSLDRRVCEKGTRLAKLSECEPTHIRLLARQAEAKSKYTDLFNRFSKVQALGQIDIDGASNLRVLQPATFNPEKVGPNRLKVLLLGILAGVAAAVGWAVLVQITDPRVRYLMSAERILAVPVLSVVSESRAFRKRVATPETARVRLDKS